MLRLCRTSNKSKKQGAYFGTLFFCVSEKAKVEGKVALYNVGTLEAQRSVSWFDENRRCERGKA